MADCNGCNQNLDEIISNVCLCMLDKFQDDLIEFAKNNWTPSHVKMLESAIECVCKGETAYPDPEATEGLDLIK